MKRIELLGRVVNGQLIINRRQLQTELSAFGNHGIRLVIEQTSKRTSPQNRYLHLLFTIFQKELNELGNEFTMQEVKDLCKYKFLKTEVFNTDSGEVIGERIKGTSELTKEDLNVFIGQIIRWAADMFHIILPYPSEQMEIMLYEYDPSHKLTLVEKG